MAPANTNNVSFSEWVISIDQDALSNLGKNMSTISNLILRIQKTNAINVPQENATRLFTSPNQKMTSFNLLVNAIVGNRELSCDALYKQSTRFPTLIKIQDNKNMVL